MELIAHWLHKGGIVLHFAGVDSISAAETLNGLMVAIPRAERAALGEDEVYIGDLIGCALVDVAGTEPVTVGEIEEVDRTAGPVALLVVQWRGGRGAGSVCEELSEKDRSGGQACRDGAAGGAGGAEREGVTCRASEPFGARSGMCLACDSRLRFCDEAEASRNSHSGLLRLWLPTGMLTLKS